jgi:peptidyl-dipeptidase Dcp
MAPTYGREENKLREIDKELSKLSLQFGENIFETNAFEMHLTDEKTLPDYPKELSKPLVLKQKRKEKKVDFHLRSSKLRSVYDLC